MCKTHLENKGFMQLPRQQKTCLMGGLKST